MALDPNVDLQPLPCNGNEEMANWSIMQTGLALLVLLAGVTDELRSQKVQNQVALLGFVFGLGCVLAIQGLSGLMVAGLSMLIALTAILPLYFMKIVSRRDVTLYAAVSVLLNWQQVLLALMGALIWASLIGVAQVLKNGEGQVLLKNLRSVFGKAKLPESEKHKVAFPIALLLGFVTSFVWTGVR
jgi:Flp pilus assembly protein protease CpaA